MCMALPQSPTSIVGANVRAEMARRQISQHTVGDHLGLSQTGISKRLAGTIPFDINEVVALAHLFQIDVTALLTGIGHKVTAA